MWNIKPARHGKWHSDPILWEPPGHLRAISLANSAGFNVTVASLPWRLERLNLYSLEKRRLRGQLIETFKMLKGVNNIDYRHLFTFSNNRTRSNGWKLELKRFNTSQCGNFFTYKIAPIWNRLPAKAVNSATVEQFKIELDKVIDTLIWFFFFRCLLGWTSKSLRHLTHCNSHTRAQTKDPNVRNY